MDHLKIILGLLGTWAISHGFGKMMEKWRANIFIKYLSILLQPLETHGVFAYTTNGRSLSNTKWPPIDSIHLQITLSKPLCLK